MGIGSALSSVFGGGNDYSYVMPPNLGPPPGPNQSTQDYQNQLYNNFQGQNQNYNDVINQAMNNKTIPQNVLDFSQANQTAGQQNSLDQMVQNRTNQNINFGTQGSMGQQQGLIDQILAQGRGEGPNPALDQLRMTTDQNAKQAAAMAASQRGIDPALAARMATQSVASANQQGAGQAALQSAQQQLGAQQLGGGLLGQQIGQQTQQAGMNAQQQAQYAQLLAQQLGQQRGQDITQASNQGQAGLNLMTANNNAESLRRQSQLAYQQQIANIFNNMNSVNAGVSSQNANTNFQYGQGAMSGLSSGMQALGMNEGGVVNPFIANVKKKRMADGGEIKPQDPSPPKPQNPEFEKLRKSKSVSDEEQMYMNMVDRKNAIHLAGGGMADYMNFASGDPFQNEMSMISRQGGGSQGSQNLFGGMSKGLAGVLGGVFGSGAVDPMMTGGKPSLGVDTSLQSPFGDMGPSNYSAKFGLMDAGDRMTGYNPFSSGGKISGKANTGGDSEKNDTVPAMLSPGEIVIPRSATKSPEDAHAFLDQIISQHEGPDYQKVQKAKEKYHKMAHGGAMDGCSYCYGGGVN